jgi:hypothetical protein
MSNFGNLTYQTVPIKERLVWQGSVMPHPKHIRCLCCHTQSGLHISDIENAAFTGPIGFHRFINGVCTTCEQKYSVGVIANPFNCKPKKKKKK